MNLIRKWCTIKSILQKDTVVLHAEDVGRNDDNSGVWQIEAMENIRNYFRERFADNEQVIIL